MLVIDDKTIESYTIPYGTTVVPDKALVECPYLRHIHIPDTVIYIGPSAFYACLSLYKVRLSKNLTVISATSFSHCTDLRSLYVPDSVVAIRSQAFYKCSKLYRISLPQTIELIDTDVFHKCDRLRWIYIRYSNVSYGVKCPRLPYSSIKGIEVGKLIIVNTAAVTIFVAFIQTIFSLFEKHSVDDGMCMASDIIWPYLNLYI